MHLRVKAVFCRQCRSIVLRIGKLVIEMIEKENGVYGDPMTDRKWTTLSERKIARFLKEDHGITISSNTVGRILKKQIQPSAKQENEGNRQT